MIIGRNGAGDYEGIAIPYVWPGEDCVRGYRLRLARPPVEYRDGKPRQGYKYMAAPGDRNKLYVPVGIEAPWLEDPAIELVITEGEFKAAALWRLAGHGVSDAAERPRFIPLGLSGVGNWRGRRGKTTDSKGQRVDETGPIPDLDRIHWRNRTVTILFDRDLESNEKVAAQRKALAWELRRRGAEVLIFAWPEENPSAKGIDDLLAAAGPDLVLHLLSEAKSFLLSFDWLKGLIMSKEGGVKVIFANAVLALRESPEWDKVLRWDEFQNRVTVHSPPFGRREGPWSDNDDRLTTIWLQQKGIYVSIETAAQAAQAVAIEHPYHPVRDYLEGLKWDGTPRLDDWLTLYLDVAQTAYTRSVGAKWLIGAMARIFNPGAKADCCLILEGAQGTYKSTACRILAGDWFTDAAIDFESAWGIMATFGSWIVELSELGDIKRADISKVKTFLSRSVDDFRPPYGRHVVSRPRQCVFIGTVNDAHYLRDETGARRFWPVRCGMIKIDDLRRDRDQLIAEAVVRFKTNEPYWIEDRDVMLQAEAEQEKRYEQDSWYDLVAPWLDGPFQRMEAGYSVQPYSSSDGNVSVLDILLHAVGKQAGQISPVDQHRVARILRKLNWETFRPESGVSGHSRGRRYRPTKP